MYYIITKTLRNGYSEILRIRAANIKKILSVSFASNKRFYSLIYKHNVYIRAPISTVMCDLHQNICEEAKNVTGGQGL